MATELKRNNYSKCPLIISYHSAQASTLATISQSGYRKTYVRNLEYSSSNYFNAIIDGVDCVCACGKNAYGHIRVIGFNSNTGNLHYDTSYDVWDCADATYTNVKQGTNAAMIAISLGTWNTGCVIHSSDGNVTYTQLPVAISSSHPYYGNIKNSSGVVKRCLMLVGFRPNNNLKLFAFDETNGNLHHNGTYSPTTGNTYTVIGSETSTIGCNVIAVGNNSPLTNCDILTIDPDQGTITRYNGIDMSGTYMQLTSGKVGQTASGSNVKGCGILSGINIAGNLSVVRCHKRNGLYHVGLNWT